MKKIIVIVSLLFTSTVWAEVYTVEEVIDAATLKLTNGEMVRLIGIKTPDDDKMGQEATEFVKSLLKERQEVRLEFDVQERDKYGRLLAYVFYGLGYSLKDRVSLIVPHYYHLMDDRKDEEYTVFINATIIKAGYATPMTIPPNVKYAELFQKLYEEARRERRGLWKTLPIPEHLQGKPNELYMRKGHEIVNAPSEDLVLARTYPTFPSKGQVVNGQRITIMTHKAKYKVGEEIRIIHVLEAVEEGYEVYVMGPKEIFGEYVDGKLVTAEKSDMGIYNGRVMQSPAVDFNYDITTYTFDEPGIHNIQWKRGGDAIPPQLALESNIISVEIVHKSCRL